MNNNPSSRPPTSKLRRNVGIALATLLLSGVGAATAFGIGQLAKSKLLKKPSATSSVSTSAKTAAAKNADKEGTTRFTVAVSGDLLIHSGLYNRALAYGHGRTYDFAPMFREIKPIIRSADLALCHVEVPMVGSRRPSGYPVFNTPPSITRAIKSTGWAGCDTASNHTLDQGQEGVNATISALNRAGLKHTGSFSSAQARNTPVMYDVKGIKVAHFSYTEMTNGIPLPHPWSVNLARPQTILADARRARKQGAQAVIVNLHSGEEYQHSPSAYQRALFAHLARSPDITAIVGQHVHVVQPIRKVEGKLVVFGEGNLISNQSSACCPLGTQEGIIALLHFAVNKDKSRVEKIDYHPVWVRHPDYTVLPIGPALKRGLASRSELSAAYKRTVSVVGRGRNVHPIPERLP